MGYYFHTTRSTVPPTGFWFFEYGDDRYTSPIYEDALKHTAEILKKHGIDTPADKALAEYMCPRLPNYFCGGGGTAPVTTAPITAWDAKLAAEKYFSKPVEPVDKITRRMQACTRCPKHQRTFCLHCHGYDQWIYEKFNGPRVYIPSDDASGCCGCSGTFEAVIASVAYGPNDPVWEGAPDTCWRHTE